VSFARETHLLFIKGILLFLVEEGGRDGRRKKRGARDFKSSVNLVTLTRVCLKAR
jgi:hypothetical protein